MTDQLGSAGNPLHVRSDPDPETSGEIVTLVERDDRRWWPIVVSVGSSVGSAVLATLLCLSVSARNADRGRESRRALQTQVCSIVITLDDNYREAPPTTEIGKRNAVSMSRLRVALGCPPAIKD